MSMQEIMKLPGVPSYWDEANRVHVHVIDLGTDQVHGYAASVVNNATGSEGLFVCVSPSLPRDRWHETVNAMLVSRNRHGGDARTDSSDFVSALDPAADTIVELSASRQPAAAK